MTGSNPTLAASVVMPAIRWSDRGWDLSDLDIGRLLEAGVPGFILFGGPATEVRALTTRHREVAGRPLLFASDLERGAGQQFAGLPGLPPLRALGSLPSDERASALAEAARLTAWGARSVGVGLVFAPVLDLDSEADNPIVGTRTPGGGSEGVAESGRVWIEACLAEGVACCAKHWPGHGRALADSHAELPVVRASAAELAADLYPFTRAIAAGVPTIMTAHVAYPTLDPSGRPATVSPVLLGRLREEFDGVVVTDALIMEGVLEPGAAPEVEALSAGVDLLLYPDDPWAAIEAVSRAVEGGRLPGARLRAARERVGGLVRRFAGPGGSDRAGAASVAELTGASARVCDRVVELPTPVADSLQANAGVPVIRVVTLDDDLGGPWPAPSREIFPETLAAQGIPLAPGEIPAEWTVLAIYAEPRAWKNRAGLSAEVLARIRFERGQAREREEGWVVVVFGGDRIVSDVVGVQDSLDLPPIVAWGGEAPMQAAAARRLSALLRSGPGARAE